MQLHRRLPPGTRPALLPVLALLAALGLVKVAGATDAARPADDCRRLAPLPSPPPGAQDVTRHGARPDDDQPDDAAIERALAALKPGDWLVFPPGRYLQARSLYVTTPNVTLWGPGATIHALDHTDLTLGLRADGVRLYGFTLTAEPGQRRTDIPGTRVSIGPGRQARSGDPPVWGNVVRGVSILPVGAAQGPPRGGASAGIFVIAASHFTIAENTVRDTLADGIHITGGSAYGRVIGNRVERTGDDAIATVSYYGKPGMAALRAGQSPVRDEQVHDVLIEGNTVGHNPWGRGIGVIGSRRITVRGNSIRGVRHAAGVIVAQEGSYLTPGAAQVLVEDNDIADIQLPPPGGWPPGTPPRTGHAAIEVHSVGNAPADLADPWVARHLVVRDITVRRNRIDGAAADGIRVGVSSAPGLVSGVRLLDNTIRGQRGQAVSERLPGAVRQRCDAGDPNGPVCQAEAGAPDVGARLDCSALP